MKTFEIYLMQKSVSDAEWRRLILKIARYNGLWRSFRVVVKNEKNRLRYFIETRRNLPATINGLEAFLIKPTASVGLPAAGGARLTLPRPGSSIADLINWAEIKEKGELVNLTIDFYNLGGESVMPRAEIYVKRGAAVRKYWLANVAPAELLAVDFAANQRYFYQKAPKYLEIKKLLPELSDQAEAGLMKIDTFPYRTGEYFLNQAAVSFDKHSVIVGASGSGKSKFLSLLIKNLHEAGLMEKYRVVVIDPHAALENEIGGLGKVVDFATHENSMDLFINKSGDVVASTELMLDLFKTLLSDQYNSRLERVLRHAVHLLLAGERFNFTNLRRLVVEPEYRNVTLRELNVKLPESVIEFFLNDFNELRTKAYTEAISPIVGFVDEMEMVPVFNGAAEGVGLTQMVQENFLTLFSLDRTRLGDKVTRTLAGLIMQQLLTLMQRREIDQHIIFVVDEVAVVENPILKRFLSEARKYNLSVVLAGQYFNQISDELQKAIFANVVNYFIFRVSGLDANLLVDNFTMKVPLDDTRERKVKILTELNTRECIARVEASENGKLLPAFKGTTLDFEPVPRVKNYNVMFTKHNVINSEHKIINFKLTNQDLHKILVATSSSRKVVK